MAASRGLPVVQNSPGRASVSKERGATLVEFAVIFPLLLLLLFAVIDFGRLAITYISVSTASREAARFGTATDDTSGVPRYVDCDGMKDAAVARVLLGDIDPDDITIEWDSGPSGSILGDCSSPLGADAIDSGHRVIVTVETEFEAITPVMGQFFGTIDLESTDKRTIFKGVINA